MKTKRDRKPDIHIMVTNKLYELLSTSENRQMKNSISQENEEKYN